MMMLLASCPPALVRSVSSAAVVYMITCSWSCNFSQTAARKITAPHGTAGQVGALYDM
eukprot:COSAG06_NODE_1644_length_8819_cov_13.898624_3_plen_58_part_00